MDLIGLNTSRDLVYHSQTRKYRSDIPQFSKKKKKAACCENVLKDDKHNSLLLSLQISSDICPWTLSGPQSLQFSSSFALGKLFLTVKRNRLCPQSNKTERIFAPNRGCKVVNIFSRQTHAIIFIFYLLSLNCQRVVASWR